MRQNHLTDYQKKGKLNYNFWTRQMSDISTNRILKTLDSPHFFKITSKHKHHIQRESDYSPPCFNAHVPFTVVAPKHIPTVIKTIHRLNTNINHVSNLNFRYTNISILWSRKMSLPFSCWLPNAAHNSTARTRPGKKRVVVSGLPSPCQHATSPGEGATHDHFSRGPKDCRRRRF